MTVVCKTRTTELKHIVMDIIYKNPAAGICHNAPEDNGVMASGPSSEEKRGRTEIRKATPEDVEFIAETVVGAMGMADVSPLLKKALTDICGMEDTLYSYRNTEIATVDGRTAGALISYDGAGYADMADKTFSLAAKAMGEKKFSPGTETVPGEYYLDSLYVSPVFRGRKIGNLLMDNALETAEGLGFTLVSLLVDIKKPWLHKIYGDLGFAMDKEVLFFGEPFYRMVQYLR